MKRGGDFGNLPMANGAALRLYAGAVLVPPFQGGAVCVGPSSQGVALGCWVIAPSVRGTPPPPIWEVTATPAAATMPSPNGAKLVSPGQRPGNPANTTNISPERATPDNAHDQAGGEFEKAIQQLPPPPKPKRKGGKT